MYNIQKIFSRSLYIRVRGSRSDANAPDNVWLTDPASTADKTSLVPDLYTIHFVVRFGDMDISAGRSMDARGLPHAFPAYDSRDTLE